MQRPASGGGQQPAGVCRVCHGQKMVTVKKGVVRPCVACAGTGRNGYRVK